jgi:hypothetical protein
VLALCLLAIVACTVTAEEAEVQGERMGFKDARASATAGGAGCRTVCRRPLLCSTACSEQQHPLLLAHLLLVLTLCIAQRCSSP